jgi:hypothetical protein
MSSDTKKVGIVFSNIILISLLFQVINISDLPFDTKLCSKAFFLVITTFILHIFTIYPSIFNLAVILYFHLIDASSLYVLQV